MPQQFPAIRLVALDLDGTLLNREGHVTPRTRAALQAAVDKGVYIVPATGRPLASLPPEVAQLPGIRYVITCNGAAVWDLGADPVGAVYSRYSNAKEHRTSTPVCLLHSLMPVETAREAFAVCESFHADLRIFRTDTPAPMPAALRWPLPGQQRRTAPKRASPTMAALPSCGTQPSG